MVAVRSVVTCLAALGVAAVLGGLAACGNTPPGSIPNVEPVVQPLPNDDDWSDVEVDEDEEDSTPASAADGGAPEGGGASDASEDDEDDEDDEDEGEDD